MLPHPCRWRQLNVTYDYSDAGEDADVSTIYWTVNGVEVTDIPWVEVHLNEDLACAVDQQGYPSCWGMPESQQDVDMTPPANTRFSKVVTGADHACGLTVDGTIECWGPKPLSAADLGQVSGAPAGSGFTDIVGGTFYTCALDTNGYATCWGIPTTAS